MNTTPPHDLPSDSPPPDPGRDPKYQRLQALLRSYQSVLLAYSGGVDSAFLLKAALDSLGPERVLACIGVSASLSRRQHDQARRLAADLGVEPVEIPLEELRDPCYRANNADRCFHCKSHLFNRCLELARERQLAVVICGSNLDDTGDYRPGMQAADRLGVRSPLIEAGLTKADIRRLSRQLNLATADRPASPCLASRVPYGLSITAERLGQVEQAEAELHRLGFEEFRVRHHDTIARIEVTADDFARLTDPELRCHIVQRFKAIGFAYIAVDLQGFRSGSLNETLPEASAPGGE